MPKPEAIITMKINGRIIEAECSLCHDRLYMDAGEASLQEQESKLHDALSRHARQRHSEK